MRRIRRVFCLLSVGLIVFSVTACSSAYAGKSDDSAMGKTIVNLKNELGIQD